MTDPLTAFDEPSDAPGKEAEQPTADTNVPEQPAAPASEPEPKPKRKSAPRRKAAAKAPADAEGTQKEASKMSGPIKDTTDVAKAARLTSERVTIILEENDNIPPTGQFIGINGKGYLLKPGEEVSVPRGVVDVLNDAVEFRPLVQDGRVTGYRKALRFPYRVMN